MQGTPGRMAQARHLVAALALIFIGAAPRAAAAPLIPPGADEAVVEVLPAITRVRPGPRMAALPASAPAVAAQVRQAIAVVRQTGDARYWGRAQALLTPWWDQPDAPVELAVLQATVLQGRHAFDAARKVLAAALARSPGHAQAWLNLAALERLSARYDASLQACDGVARAQALLYARACQLETRSLQGDTQAVTQGLHELAQAATQSGQRGWLLSLLAEHLERAGNDRAAARAYRESLQQDADLYTAIAYSDLLLRTGQPALALQVLARLPDTDAVLLRRATAWRRSGDPQWVATRAQLRERVADLTRRGDDATLHGRELALTALWLDDDAPGALVLARANLQLQREPVDWWLAVASARAARNAEVLARLETAIQSAGLHDVRLAHASAAGSPAASRARP